MGLSPCRLVLRAHPLRHRPHPLSPSPRVPPSRYSRTAIFALFPARARYAFPRAQSHTRIHRSSSSLFAVVFGVNDVYDYPSDRHNPRKLADALEGIVLRPELHAAVIISAWAATASILAASLLVVRPHNTIVIVALLVLSWQYSAPPLRFKERPVLDSISNGAIVNLAYLAGYTAGGGRLDAQMLRLRGHVLGLCTTGVHALGAAVDVDADAAAGQRTIATVFGPRIAIAFGAAN